MVTTRQKIKMNTCWPVHPTPYMLVSYFHISHRCHKSPLHPITNIKSFKNPDFTSLQQNRFYTTIREII